MSSQGYIYVLINPAMPGLLKIGLTAKTPEERVKELSSATGVPISFILIYKEFFRDCVLAEKTIHAHLEAQGFRLNKSREFFEAETCDVVDIIKEVKAIEKEVGNYIAEDVTEDTEQQPWEYYQNKADEYYYGLGDELQDYAEAYANYLKAFELKSPKAHKILGDMCIAGEGVRANSEDALKYYKAGVERGDSSCWYDIAMFYHEKGHGLNFVKSTQNLLKTYNIEDELSIMRLMVIMSSMNNDYLYAHIDLNDICAIYEMIDVFKPDITNFLQNLDDIEKSASYTNTVIGLCSNAGENEDILYYAQICMKRFSETNQIKRDNITWDSLGMVMDLFNLLVHEEVDTVKSTSLLLVTFGDQVYDLVNYCDKSIIFLNQVIADYDSMIANLISSRKRSGVTDKQFNTAMEGISYLESKITNLYVIKNAILNNIHYEKSKAQKRSYISYIVKDIKSIIPFKLYYLINSHREIDYNDQKKSHRIIAERLEYYKSDGWVVDSETPGIINLKKPKFFSIIRAGGLFWLTLPVYGIGALFYLAYYFSNSEEWLPFNKIGFLENRGCFIQKELE